VRSEFKLAISAYFSSCSLLAAQTFEFNQELWKQIQKYETVCISTIYEGASRGPLGAFPDMRNARHHAQIGSTPSKHITLMLFSKEGYWDFKHVNNSYFISTDKYIEFDSSFIFTEEPIGFSYCKKIANMNIEIKCVYIFTEIKINYCAPLFTKRMDT
jgi:hypothetical protein